MRSMVEGRRATSPLRHRPVAGATSPFACGEQGGSQTNYPAVIFSTAPSVSSVVT